MEQETNRWVAAPGDAFDAARTYARVRLRRRTTWVTLVALWLVTGWILYVALDDAVPAGTRLVRAYLTVTLLWMVVVPLSLRLGRRATARRLSTRIGPGTVLTSTFGPESFELAGPSSSHRFSYADIASVQREGHWVLLRQRGSKVDLLWPSGLFPERDLARLRGQADTP